MEKTSFARGHEIQSGGQDSASFGFKNGMGVKGFFFKKKKKEKLMDR